MKSFKVIFWKKNNYTGHSADPSQPIGNFSSINYAINYCKKNYEGFSKETKDQPENISYIEIQEINEENTKTVLFLVKK